MERENTFTNSGDEPGLCNNGLPGRNSLSGATGAAAPITTIAACVNDNDDGGYVPTPNCQRGGSSQPLSAQQFALLRLTDELPAIYDAVGYDRTEDDDDDDDDEDDDDDDDDDDEEDVTSADSSDSEAGAAGTDVTLAVAASASAACAAANFAPAAPPPANNHWVRPDAYRLDAFDQVQGVWPIDQPLPLPRWSGKQKETLVVQKLWQYEDLCAKIEVTLHRMLEETHYNTVNNFVDFHAAFRRAHPTKPSTATVTTEDLRPFYHGYVPPINRRHHMCVSLAMEIVGRLAADNPQLAQHMYIVSCEEAVDGTGAYVEHCAAVGMESVVAALEKEHALIAMRVRVAGRDGLMCIDPGYHVARAVTVMRDGCYPHTGWFTQSEEPHCKREYRYQMCATRLSPAGGARNGSSADGEFVEWSERVTRAGGAVTEEVSLVYVGRPYRTAVDVTVRRNLVYNFRSLLSRNAKGRVCAGIYFPVSTAGADGQLTLFYDGANEASVKVKQKFAAFRNGCATIGDGLRAHLDQLAAQLRMTGAELDQLMGSLHDVMCDQAFVKQVLAINDDVTEMSADN